MWRESIHKDMVESKILLCYSKRFKSTDSKNKTDSTSELQVLLKLVQKASYE